MKKRFLSIFLCMIVLFVNLSAVSFAQSPQTFADVPESYWAYPWIEALFQAGITEGCEKNPLKFCPDDIVTRAQIAIFLKRGKMGGDYIPPKTSVSSFIDVPLGSLTVDWIEVLHSDGITMGCQQDPPRYCPNDPVTRSEMAIFLLRTLYGGHYTPPRIEGTSGFNDVYPGDFAAAWIKQLVKEGITSGCGNGNYCPNDPVTRAELSVFISKAFDLNIESDDCQLNAEELALASLLKSDPNQQRTSMQCDPILSKVARERALDMGNRNYFSHTNPDGFGPNYLVQQAGYPLPIFYSQDLDGNNIESIQGGCSSSSCAWSAWMNSDGHSRHLLGLSSFFVEQTDFGVGYAYVPNSKYGFYWVIITARKGP